MQQFASYHGGAAPAGGSAYSGGGLPSAAGWEYLKLDPDVFRPCVSSPTNEFDTSWSGINHHVQSFRNTGGDECCYAPLDMSGWDMTINPVVVMTFYDSGAAASQTVWGVSIKLYDENDPMGAFSTSGARINHTKAGASLDVDRVVWSDGGTPPSMLGNVSSSLRYGVMKMQRWNTQPFDTFTGNNQMVHCGVWYLLT